MNRNKGEDVAPVLQEKYGAHGFRFAAGEKNYVNVLIPWCNYDKYVTEKQLDFIRTRRIYWKSKTNIGLMGRWVATQLLDMAMEYRNINFVVRFC